MSDGRLQCSQCNREVSEGAPYCRWCGAELNGRLAEHQLESEEPPPPPPPASDGEMTQTAHDAADRGPGRTGAMRVIGYIAAVIFGLMGLVFFIAATEEDPLASTIIGVMFVAIAGLAIYLARPTEESMTSEYGGFWHRAAAATADLVILGVLSILIAEGVPSEDLAVAAILTIWVAYAPGFEMSRLQGTPGKRLLGLAVTGTDGDRATAGQVILRNLVKYLCWAFPPIFAVAAFHPQKRALHDFAGGTCVVTRPPDWAGIAAWSSRAWDTLSRRRRTVAAVTAILVLIIGGTIGYSSRMEAWRLECGETLARAAQGAGIPISSIPPELLSLPTLDDIAGLTSDSEPEGTAIEEGVQFPAADGLQIRQLPVPPLRRSSKLIVGYNAHLSGFGTPLVMQPDDRPEELVVMAEAARPEITDLDEIAYPHGGRAWVLTADGSLRLIGPDETDLRLHHRDDLYDEDAPMIDLSDLTTEPSALKSRLELSRSDDLTFVAPLQCDDEERRVICQYLSPSPSAATRLQMRIDFESLRPHTGNIFAALGVDEQQLHYAPARGGQQRLYFTNCGPFERVDLLLDDDGVSVNSLFLDTASDEIPTEAIASGTWHLDNSACLWMDAVGDLPQTGTVEPDRAAIISAQNVAWIICSDFQDWEHGHSLVRTRDHNNLHVAHNDLHGYGNFQQADIVVAIYDYDRRFVSRSAFYSPSDAPGPGGRITYYRNSLRVAVFDAHNPERLLMLRHISKSPQREGREIRRSFGWSGEEKDAADALAQQLEATLEALDL